MIENPKNGDLVKFWHQKPDDEPGYVYGVVDMAIPLVGGNITHLVRVIDNDGHAHNKSNDELVYHCRYINVYSVSRQFGGPEEGGWYYDAGYPLASIPYRNEHDGQRLRNEMLQMFPKTKGMGRSSVLGGDDFEIYSDDNFAEPFPKERPHYE